MDTTKQKQSNPQQTGRRPLHTSSECVQLDVSGNSRSPETVGPVCVSAVLTLRLRLGIRKKRVPQTRIKMRL